MTGNRYPNDFRLKVAQEAIEGSVPLLAKRYKLSTPSIYKWRDLYKSKGKVAFKEPGKRVPASKTMNGSSDVPKALQKRIEQVALGVLSTALGEVVADLQSLLAVEQQKRREAEQSLERFKKLIREV